MILDAGDKGVRVNRGEHMTYDLLVKNGTVIDGSGNPGYRADVGVVDGKIAAIGRLNSKAKQTVDAEGHVVSPGFVDGHTHMDAQVFWDPIGSCSSYHGVTSVVMGNCGFTLAPCKQEDADLVFKNLERAEDLSRDAMLEGIDWSWETFPQFLDAIDDLPKGINYAGYIGHSALRTYVMGERAFVDQASEDEVRKMQHIVKEAMGAGAIGFSTSRTFNHLTADDLPVASRVAHWDEVRAIVNAVGETGKGLFEIAGEAPGRDPERIREYHQRLMNLAVESGVPQTWGMFSVRAAPDLWRPYFDLLDETARAGGRMYAQVHSRALSSLLSFQSNTPFDNWEYWSEFRQLPLAEQFFRQPIANENQDHVLEMMKHPRSVVTFSDSGAHVSQIMDSSLQTHLLSYWVREKQALTLEEAIKQITYNTATMWGLHDRGLVREGMAADLVVFDPDTVGARMPEVVHDLPSGARRLKQTADGILHTVVNGEIMLTNNEHTGAVPGRLLRS